MGNVISNANDIFPRYLWTFRKKVSLTYLINLLDALTNRLQQHTTGSQFLHPSRRRVIIFCRINSCIPLLKLIDCCIYLLKDLLY